MPWWSVQAAWQGGLHPQSSGRSEERAKKDVERLMYSWMIPHLVGHGQFYQAQGSRLDYGRDAIKTAGEIQRLIEARDIWGAYDVFHDFQDRWEREFDVPMWYVIGTIIVEAPEGMGPRARKRFITQEDFPAQPPPGFLRMETPFIQKKELPPGQYRMQGDELGAKACRFLVWRADRLGRKHSSCHMHWKNAAATLGRYLAGLAGRMDRHAREIDPDSPHQEYAQAAWRAASAILANVEAGDVYAAYEAYRLFEGSFYDEFREPFSDIFGEVRLEVD